MQLVWDVRPDGVDREGLIAGEAPSAFRVETETPAPDGESLFDFPGGENLGTAAATRASWQPRSRRFDAGHRFGRSIREISSILMGAPPGPLVSTACTDLAAQPLPRPPVAPLGLIGSTLNDPLEACLLPLSVEL